MGPLKGSQRDNSSKVKGTDWVVKQSVWMRHDRSVCLCRDYKTPWTLISGPLHSHTTHLQMIVLFSLLLWNRTLASFPKQSFRHAPSIEQCEHREKAVWFCWSSTLVRWLFSGSLGHQLHHSLLEDDTSEGGGQGKYLDLQQVSGGARRRKTHGFWLGRHIVATSLRLSQLHSEASCISSIINPQMLNKSTRY